MCQSAISAMLALLLASLHMHEFQRISTQVSPDCFALHAFVV